MIENSATGRVIYNAADGAVAVAETATITPEGAMFPLTTSYDRATGKGASARLALTAKAGNFDGIGTAEDPCLMKDINDLTRLATDVNNGKTYANAYFQMTADIDLTSVQSWTPIGTSLNQFKGAFDGNNHQVQNLKTTAKVTNCYNANAGNPKAESCVSLGLAVTPGDANTQIGRVIANNSDGTISGNQARAGMLVNSSIIPTSDPSTQTAR